MPKIRDILIQITVEEAQRQRICRRHKTHKIIKGQMCLVIPTNSTDDPYSYCPDAAKPILDAAWVKLLSLYVGLGLTPPTQSDS